MRRGMKAFIAHCKIQVLDKQYLCSDFNPVTLLSVWGSNWLFIFSQTSIQWPDKCYLSEAQFGCLYFVAVINSRLGLHWPTKPPKQKPNAAFKCNSSSVCLYNHNCACYLYFKPKWNQNETSILWWFQKFTTKQVFGEGCWVSLVISLTDEECLQLVCYGHWPLAIGHVMTGFNGSVHS